MVRVVVRRPVRVMVWARTTRLVRRCWGRSSIPVILAFRSPLRLVTVFAVRRLVIRRSPGRTLIEVPVRRRLVTVHVLGRRWAVIRVTTAAIGVIPPNQVMAVAIVVVLVTSVMAVAIGATLVTSVTAVAIVVTPVTWVMAVVIGATPVMRAPIGIRTRGSIRMGRCRRELRMGTGRVWVGTCRDRPTAHTFRIRRTSTRSSSRCRASIPSPGRFRHCN